MHGCWMHTTLQSHSNELGCILGHLNAFQSSWNLMQSITPTEPAKHQDLPFFSLKMSTVDGKCCLCFPKERGISCVPIVLQLSNKVHQGLLATITNMSWLCFPGSCATPNSLHIDRTQEEQVILAAASALEQLWPKPWPHIRTWH